jgi:hypothetical protein
LLNSHAKTPRRKERYSKLSVFAALREVIFIKHDMYNYFDVTLLEPPALLIGEPNFCIQIMLTVLLGQKFKK